MAKEESTLEFYYKANCEPIYKADSFIYELVVYEYFKTGFTLYEHKVKTTKEFKGLGSRSESTVKNKKYVKIIELIGAPEEFLKKENYGLSQHSGSGVRKTRSGRQRVL
jgi:hypothetical protein